MHTGGQIRHGWHWTRGPLYVFIWLRKWEVFTTFWSENV